jgi:hypothetical protein
VTCQGGGLRLHCDCRDGDAKLRLSGVLAGRIRGPILRPATRLELLAAALLLGACSMPDFDTMRLPSSATLFRPYSVTSFRDKPLAPITAADLVDANGICANPAPVGADPSAPPDATPPGRGSGVTLEMTECEVVQRAGAPQNVNIGTSDTGERAVAMTIATGSRPGIYHFVGGRLKSMERGPEAAPEPKPTKRAAKPKRQTATQ